jgi:hypothetical protein
MAVAGFVPCWDEKRRPKIYYDNASCKSDS